MFCCKVTDGAITHVADFMQVISPDLRLAFLSALLSINVPNNNWRRRLAITEQLLIVTPLFPSATVEQRIIPSVLTLAQDPVACVKRQACKTCAVVLGHLQTDADQSYAHTLCQRLITEMAHAAHSAARQSFALICVHMCDHVASAFIAAEVLDVMCALVEDNVPNVRLVAAAFFRQAHDKDFFGDTTGADDKVARALARLTVDAVCFRELHTKQVYFDILCRSSTLLVAYTSSCCIFLYYACGNVLATCSLVCIVALLDLVAFVHKSVTLLNPTMCHRASPPYPRTQSPGSIPELVV